MKWFRTVVPILGCNLALGCGEAADPGTDADGATTSAGVPIALDTTPRIRIGEMGGPPEEELFRVVSPFVLPDGRLVIPVAGFDVVRLYSDDGVLESTHGREGEGPGEFMEITGAWSRGDTIEVHDYNLGRITRFIGEDSVETFRSPSSPRGAFGAGWVLSEVVASAPGYTMRDGKPILLGAGDPVEPDTIGFRRFGREGSDQGEFLRMPGLSRYLTSAGRYSPEPMSPDARYVINGTRMYVGHTLEPSIRVVDSAGVLVREIRWTPDPAPDSESTLRAVLEKDAAEVDPFRNPNISRVGYSDAPVPARLSVFWGLLVDSEGFVWVLPYDPMKHAHALGGWRGPGPGGRWMVFDPSGAKVADIEMPPLLYPSQITRDAVVGIERDPLGVEMVSVYSLRRR